MVSRKAGCMSELSHYIVLEVRSTVRSHGRHFNKIKSAFSLLFHGYLRTFLKEVVRVIASEETSYVFRRDLCLPFKPYPSSIPITIRPFVKMDMTLLELGNARNPVNAVMERVTRIETIEADIPSSVYVAVTTDGSPCFQWLVLPEQNTRLSTYYKGYCASTPKTRCCWRGRFAPSSTGERGLWLAPCRRSRKKAGQRGLAGPSHTSKNLIYPPFVAVWHAAFAPTSEKRLHGRPSGGKFHLSH